MPFEKRVQVAFFRKHRLALDDFLHRVRLQQRKHDRVMLGRVASPVNFGPQADRLPLENIAKWRKKASELVDKVNFDAGPDS